jgi:peptide/nickel transport system permease protein
VFGYLVRRLMHSVVVLFGVLLVVFVMVNLVGDPARLMLPPEAPESEYLLLRSRLGLDDPFLERLGRTLGGWAHGDFGDSLWQGVPALPLALEQVPATLYAAAAAMLIALPIALALSTYAAVRGPGSLCDRFVTVVSLLGVSVAEFWLGLMLILIVSVKMGLLPPSGYGGLEYVILPAITLAGRPMGRIAQVSRAALMEEMDKPYVLTLEAKGLSRGRIVTRHALKNTSIPVITIVGDEVATFVNGTVVVGTIFAFAGLGPLFINAIERRDLPLVEACVFVVAIMTIAINLIVDLTYAYLDPRTRRSPVGVR